MKGSKQVSSVDCGESLRLSWVISSLPGNAVALCVWAAALFFWWSRFWLPCFCTSAKNWKSRCNNRIGFLRRIDCSSCHHTTYVNWHSGERAN